FSYSEVVIVALSRLQAGVGRRAEGQGRPPVWLWLDESTRFSGKRARSIIRPSFITDFSLRMLCMSARGSASRISISASLPTSIVPYSSSLRQARAPFLVAAGNALAGGAAGCATPPCPPL